jgi:hypothetical protein
MNMNAWKHEAYGVWTWNMKHETWAWAYGNLWSMKHETWKHGSLWSIYEHDMKHEAWNIEWMKHETSKHEVEMETWNHGNIWNMVMKLMKNGNMEHETWTWKHGNMDMKHEAWKLMSMETWKHGSTWNMMTYEHMETWAAWSNGMKHETLWKHEAWAWTWHGTYEAWNMKHGMKHGNMKHGNIVWNLWNMKHETWRHGNYKTWSYGSMMKHDYDTYLWNMKHETWAWAWSHEAWAWAGMSMSMKHGSNEHEHETMKWRMAETWAWSAWRMTYDAWKHGNMKHGAWTRSAWTWAWNMSMKRYAGTWGNWPSMSMKHECEHEHEPNMVWPWYGMSMKEWNMVWSMKHVMEERSKHEHGTWAMSNELISMEHETWKQQAYEHEAYETYNTWPMTCKLIWKLMKNVYETWNYDTMKHYETWN